MFVGREVNLLGLFLLDGLVKAGLLLGVARCVSRLQLLADLLQNTELFITDLWESRPPDK